MFVQQHVSAQQTSACAQSLKSVCSRTRQQLRGDTVQNIEHRVAYSARHIENWNFLAKLATRYPIIERRVSYSARNSPVIPLRCLGSSKRRTVNGMESNGWNSSSCEREQQKKAWGTYLPLQVLLVCPIKPTGAVKLGFSSRVLLFRLATSEVRPQQRLRQFLFPTRANTSLIQSGERQFKMVSVSRCLVSAFPNKFYFNAWTLKWRSESSRCEEIFFGDHLKIRKNYCSEDLFYFFYLFGDRRQRKDIAPQIFDCPPQKFHSSYVSI